MAKIGDIEDISDMMTDKAFKKFKKGQILKFSNGVNLKITKIDRKNRIMLAEHITLVDQKIVRSHFGHNVIPGGEGDFPFCNDCQTSVNDPSTEDGDKKALDRADRTLSDGTEIE